MNREYHRWWSNDLQRDMELLVLWPRLAPRYWSFPTSHGKILMSTKTTRWLPRLPIGLALRPAADLIASTASTWKAGTTNRRIPTGACSGICNTSAISSTTSIPLMWNVNWTPRLIVTGCSFGAYHAVNFAFRNPDKVTGCVTMGGSFDIKIFLDGWYSEDVYFNNPADYLANCTDGWRYNHMRTVLATGEWDMCWEKNEELCRQFAGRGIRNELCVWGDQQLSRLAVVASDGADLSGVSDQKFAEIHRYFLMGALRLKPFVERRAMSLSAYW